MDSQIRNVELNDINDLIRINELSIPAVNSITEAKFEWFYNNSLYFRLIKSSGDEIYGFLLALNPALDYESINYKWFQNRYDQFAYIDRVAILKKYKRNGLGKKLYSDLEQTIKDNYKMITCEYNLKPMNLESEKFHLAIDYERVGSLVTENGAKEVSLMLKNI